MYSRIIIVAIVICQSFTSYSFSQDSTKSECSGKPLQLDIPADRKTDKFKQIKEKYLKVAGLVDLEKGFNELQYRIAYAYSSDTEDFIILSKVNGKWNGSIITLKYNYLPYSDSLISADKTVRIVTPVSGWQVFTDSLLTLGIKQLPDMSQIPGYTFWIDGRWFSVEIATCEAYKYYSYQEPWGSDFPQAKKASKISDFIEKELGFDRRFK